MRRVDVVAPGRLDGDVIKGLAAVAEINTLVCADGVGLGVVARGVNGGVGIPAGPRM